LAVTITPHLIKEKKYDLRIKKKKEKNHAGRELQSRNNRSPQQLMKGSHFGTEYRKPPPPPHREPPPSHRFRGKNVASIYKQCCAHTASFKNGTVNNDRK
jgi:hypothetical protein